MAKRSQRHLREFETIDSTGYSQNRANAYTASTLAAQTALEQACGAARVAGDSAPTVANAITNKSLPAGIAWTFQFASNTFSDVDVGDTLTYVAWLDNGLPLPSWMTFTPSTRTFAGTPPIADIGHYYGIRVSAVDVAAKVVTTTFKVTVTAGSAPTVANALVDQTVIHAIPKTYQFASNSFADADSGDALTYSAKLSSGATLPAWITFVAGTRTFTITAPAADSAATVRVTATDLAYNTVTDDFDVASSTNNAPTVANALIDQTATQSVPFSYQFASNSFADADTNDVLTYSATKGDDTALPAWITFTPSTRTFAGTPTVGDVGTLTVKVTATDLALNTVTDTFDIVVS